MIKINERIYAIQTPYDGVYVCSYVIAGERAAVVDTGLVSTGKSILALLDSLGSPKLEVAVHTHGHWDHIGSAAQLQLATGCLVAAHVGDADMLASYKVNDRRFLRRFPEYPPSVEDVKSVYDRIGREVRVDLQLNGGECFCLGRGVVLQTVPMPGHTPGSIGVFERESGSLFVGDSLPGRGPFGTLAQYEDVSIYRETIRKVMSLNVRQILPGHSAPIVGEAAVQRFLEDCLDEVCIIDNNVRAESAVGCDFIEIAKAVCRRMNKPFMLQPLFTTQAHLKDMKIKENQHG